MKRILIASMLLLLLIACTQKPIENTGNAPDNGLETGSIGLTATDELKKFDSKAEIIEYLKENQASGGNNYFNGFRRGGVMALAESAAMDVKTMGSSPSSAPSPSAGDYSTTNIQVKGVDEADFIKNDGKYIYMVANNKLVIVKAFPADQAEIVSETNIKGYPTELFLSGDQVIVFANYNDEVMGFNEYDAIPRPMYEQKTRAIVFDVSDREDPEVKYDFDIKGNYVTSRMIGDYIYFVAQDPVYYYGPFIDTPVLRESGKVMIRPPV
ncbi:MAG: beta-propeller domain-containing protein, partial [Candidatus Woesearchaeota archaeon]|nr:beta-propeller domain-containing protein [Candidatus Woesearchaeota archaeon]